MSSPDDEIKAPTTVKVDDKRPQDESMGEMEGGKRSAWMAHVKKTMRANKGKSLSQVLKMAAKTYKKSGKKTARKGRKSRKFMGMFGGSKVGVAETAASLSGGRRGGRKH